MNVTIKDFIPINNWKLDSIGPFWSNGREPKFLVDQSTHRRYFNESKGVVRFKCFLLTLGTPFVHPVASIVNVAKKIVKLVTFANFWMHKDKEPKYIFKSRLADTGIDLLKIIATPFSLVGLELASLYGLVRPYDGRKLYATIERATYGGYILAPCFQPDPNHHLFGGDLNKQNAF